MSKQKSVASFFNGAAFGLGVGVASGVAATLWLKKQRQLKADDLLNKIKKAFLAEGPIEGSWIEQTPQTIQQYALTTRIYRGGIIRKEDEVLVAYEFSADADTGTVLSIERVTY